MAIKDNSLCSLFPLLCRDFLFSFPSFGGKGSRDEPLGRGTAEEKRGRDGETKGQAEREKQGGKKRKRKGERGEEQTEAGGGRK